MTRVAALLLVLTMTGAAAAQDAPDPDNDTAIERSGGAGAAYDAFLSGRYEEAIAIWLPMANGGLAVAQFNLGVMYANGLGVDRDMGVAMDWWARAAGQLHVRSAHNLALAMLAGEPVMNGRKAEPDYPAILRYLKIGGDAGYPNSEYTLGWLYADGIGVERDPRRAAELFLSAGIKGFAKAQYNLGLIYRDGLGAPADEQLSLFWFKQAAERGHAAAEDQLGDRCLSGLGMAKDEVEALKWSILAAQQEIASSQRRRFDLAASLPQGEITEAEARAARFAPKKGPVLDLPTRSK